MRERERNVYIFHKIISHTTEKRRRKTFLRIQFVYEIKFILFFIITWHALHRRKRSKKEI